MDTTIFLWIYIFVILIRPQKSQKSIPCPFLVQFKNLLSLLSLSLSYAPIHLLFAFTKEKPNKASAPNLTQLLCISISLDRERKRVREREALTLGLPQTKRGEKKRKEVQREPIPHLFYVKLQSIS